MNLITGLLLQDDEIAKKIEMLSKLSGSASGMEITYEEGENGEEVIEHKDYLEFVFKYNNIQASFKGSHKIKEEMKHFGKGFYKILQAVPDKTFEEIHEKAEEIKSKLGEGVLEEKSKEVDNILKDISYINDILQLKGEKVNEIIEYTNNLLKTK